MPSASHKDLILAMQLATEAFGHRPKLIAFGNPRGFSPIEAIIKHDGARATIDAPMAQQAMKGMGAGYAERVAYWVREDLERRYPDAVNARCVGVAGESHLVGIVAVTWMRGREVFHRRHEVSAQWGWASDVVGRPRHIASIILPTIIRQIDATEGAERP